MRPKCDRIAAKAVTARLCFCRVLFARAHAQQRRTRQVAEPAWIRPVGRAG